jgi:putative ABC transport system permease protein
MAVVANTMAMTTRERIGEYAVLKTLGFGRGAVAGLIFGESLVVSFAGCLLGKVLTFPAVAAFGHTLAKFFPIFRVAPETLCLDFLAALVIGCTVAVIPTRQAIRITIADGLRRIG